MLSYPILVSMACLLTSCNVQIMQNTPFNGAGRRPAPPSLQLFLLLKQYIYILCSIRSVQNMYVLCFAGICNHSEKSKSTCSRCTGGPGRLLAPPPAPLAELCGGGGGGGWRAMFCLGILSGEGGISGSKFGGSYSRVDLACFHGKTFWRVCLAGLFGGSVWHIYLAGFHKQ